MSSRPVEDEHFRKYAQLINDQLEIHGAWFFQVKQDRNGKYKLLEIAPRIAGTMALHRVLGINFPLLSIFEQDRIPISIMKNKGVVHIERSLINRYRHFISYDTVYVDLDDTLIVNDKINTELIQFLYQCINRNIKLILLTKHRNNLTRVLKKHRVSGLFDEISHMKQEDKKSLYIKETNAIFIDDSFSERSEINVKCKIPTFDSSMIELLIDHRA